MYTGKGEELHRRYEFRAVYFDKETRAIGNVDNVNSPNLRHAFNHLAARLYSNYFNRFRDIAWLIIAKDRGVVACSEEKKMESPLCLKMLGYSLQQRYFRFDHVPEALKVIYPNLQRNHPDYYQIAITADSTKLNEVPKVHNLTKDEKIATDKYNELCPMDMKKRAPERTVCARASTYNDVIRDHRTMLLGAEARLDVY